MVFYIRFFAVSIIVFVFYETQSIHMQIKCCSFLNFMFFILYFGKKARASSICKRFVFPETSDPPKVTTPLKERPLKAANSESNEGRYYRNSTVV